MPTEKPSRRLFYSEEELRELFGVWTELRNPGRRRGPEYIGQRLTFNQWLKGLTAEGAARARAALTSGTVERPMTTKTKTAKAPEPAKTTPPSPRRGRPPGRKKVTVGFSLDPDVAEYAKDLGSAKVNTILRRSMERRGTR